MIKTGDQLPDVTLYQYNSDAGACAIGPMAFSIRERCKHKKVLIFGLPAERVMGPWRFLALFLLGGAFANFVAALAIGTPDRLIIGASGAVSAIIGAYLALFPRARLGVVLPLGLFLEFVRAPASLLIGLWAVLQVVFAYIGPAFGTVAWAAHAGGFVFGAAFALASRQAIARRLRRLQGY